MIIRCTQKTWEHMESLMPAEAPCGRTYDDAERSRICPHNELAGGTQSLVCKSTDMYVSLCPCPKHLNVDGMSNYK